MERIKEGERRGGVKIKADFLKAYYFAKSKCSGWKCCAENALELPTFVKLGQIQKISSSFSCFAFSSPKLAEILKHFAKSCDCMIKAFRNWGCKANTLNYFVLVYPLSNWLHKSCCTLQLICTAKCSTSNIFPTYHCRMVVHVTFHFNYNFNYEDVKLKWPPFSL